MPVREKFEVVPDASAITPTTVDQLARWANGEEEFGAVIHPVNTHDTDFTTFKNLGDGGTIGLYDKNNHLMFFVPSNAATPRFIYGPNGEKLATSDNAMTFKNKTMNEGEGNDIHAGAIQRGIINIARLPAAMRQFKTKSDDAELTRGTAGWQDIFDVTIDDVLSGSNLLGIFSNTLWVDSTSNSPTGKIDMRIRIGSDADIDVGNVNPAISDSRHGFSFPFWFPDVTSGNKTITVGWQRVAGTAHSTFRRILVLEFRD